MVLWARVSPEVDTKLAASSDPILRLEPKDWRSGDILWVIEVLGHKDAVPAILAQFQQSVAKERTARMRIRGNEGYRIVTLAKAAEPIATGPEGAK